VCGRGSDTDGLNAAGTAASIDAEREGQAVVVEEGVLSLVLRACSVFQNQAEVVKACCMLMKVGVQCSLRCGGAEVSTRRGGSATLRSRPSHEKSTVSRRPYSLPALLPPAHIIPSVNHGQEETLVALRILSNGFLSVVLLVDTV